MSDKDPGSAASAKALLFLDMDGVLNSSQSANMYWRTRHGRKTFMQGWEELCPIACNNLNHVLWRMSKLRVVISSTWRLHYPFEEWNKNEHLLSLCPEIRGRVIGSTPGHLDGGPRGHEINLWLKDNGHLERGTPFVVLDDNEDMDLVSRRFVHVDEKIGFSWHDMMRVFVMMGCSP